MNSQKADNELNLALDVPEGTRKKSLELGIGYEEKNDTWELIVKHSGNLDLIRRELDVDITELTANYAIIIIKESLISKLEEYEEIEYIEKPKLLNFHVNRGIEVSCIRQAWEAPANLSGKGTIVAIIDTGIDYAHPDFLNRDGTTRIMYLWDQTIAGNPPSGYSLGTLYTSEQINEALKQPTMAKRMEVVPSTDIEGHGTHVAGISCGNGQASKGVNRGVAFESAIIIVKLGASLHNSYPSTAQLMQALDFVAKKSLELNMPIAINVSFGNAYGSHSGESLLETFINNVADLGRLNICIGTGNDGASNRHYQTVLEEGKTKRIEVSVAEREGGLNMQLWRNPYDYMDFTLINPSGIRVGPINQVLGTQKHVVGDTTVYLYYGEPTPYSIYQELYVVWIPNETYVTSGLWTVEIEPKKVVGGEIYMWLPAGGRLNQNTKFLTPSVDTTLTIPSTALKAITVGAYNGLDDSIAVFSGRGYTINNQIKPDLVAPGVDILSSAPGGGYSVKSGTSMATPFVTGSCALLMQWGIVQGQDKYMYGQKVKAQLLSSARHLKAFTIYPNQVVGYGALCLKKIE